MRQGTFRLVTSSPPIWSPSIGLYEKAESALAAAGRLAPEEEKELYQALQRAVAFQRMEQYEKAAEEVRRVLSLTLAVDRAVLEVYLLWLERKSEER